MSRSPTTNLNTQLTATVTRSGYLVEIDIIGAAALHLCSLDVGFTYNSLTWTSADIQLNGVGWTNTGIGPGTLILGDADQQYWTYALNLELQDAVVSIWQVYADAPGEAEPLWTGRVGQVARGDQEVQLSLVPDNQVRIVPVRRIQSVIDPAYLIAPGTVLSVGSMQWTITAPLGGN